MTEQKHGSLAGAVFGRLRVLRIEEWACFLLLVPAQLWAPFVIRGLEAGAPLSFEAMYFAESVSVLLMAIVFHKAGQSGPIGRPGLGSWLLAAMFCVVPFVVLFKDALPQPASIVIGAIFGASARMWFYARSVLVYERFGIEKGVRCVLISFLASIPLRMFLEMLPSMAVLPIIVLLPFAFVLMLRLIQGDECVSAVREKHPLRLSARTVTPLVLEAVLFGVVMGLYRLSAIIWQVYAGANLLNLLFKIAFLSVLLAGLAHPKTKRAFLRVNAQFQIALIFIVATVVSVTFTVGPQETMVVAAVVADFARYSIGICLLIVSLVVASRYRISSSTALFLCWAPYALAFGVGFAVANGFDVAALYSETFVLNTALLIIAATFVILNAISSAEERFFSIDGTGAQQISQFDYINKQCEKIAEYTDLTPRELQIMQMICKGRSKRYIAEHFVISENTVRWHAKNLYVKLGVCNRQELLDLIGVD